MRAANVPVFLMERSWWKVLCDTIHREGVIVVEGCDKGED